MSTPPVTVAIPVGPYPANKRWLTQCLESVRDQTYKVDEILLIDDMAWLKPEEVKAPWPNAYVVEVEPTNSFERSGFVLDDMEYDPDEPAESKQWYTGFLKVVRAPWRLGVAHAFNFGVALARNELVFMLGSDDWLEPQCIQRCVSKYKKDGKRGDVYYFVSVRYTDGREQNVPCNAAMVTKSLWRKCGGFPPETASGAPDAALVSIFMKNPQAGRYVGVAEKVPLYNYRPHDETDTAGRQPWQGIIGQTRTLVMDHWSEPTWTKGIS